MPRPKAVFDIRGLEHLTGVTRLDTKLVHHNCEARLVEVMNAAGHLDHIALIYTNHADHGICQEAGSNPRAWKRVGRQNIVLNDLQRQQLRQEERIVDFKWTNNPAHAIALSDASLGKRGLAFLVPHAAA